ncbi:hypothetical protein GXP70_22560 [Paenibacillus lycopersici]|uniref:Uncharacterized protein n=1 Tax=Paenibacillus lycopersici TaxID=2704462 RepID=A0A6C0G3B7_9BACL|nr:hypothetical protein [Paenibacillus lycopersici]QHT62493.1 hypothetical protein GXP70_22560 [Paenibacillus lycopersici]
MLEQQLFRHFAGPWLEELLEQQLYQRFYRSEAGKVARTATLSSLSPVRGWKSCPNSNFIVIITDPWLEKLLEQQLYRHYHRSVAGKVARTATLPTFAGPWLGKLPEQQLYRHLPVRGGKSCSNSNFIGIITG